MKNYMRYFLLLAVVIVGMIQCADDVDRGIPTLKDDAPPSPVTGVQVEAIPGGAILSYTLPKSANLLYVMAEYTIGDKLFEKKSSFYSNNLTVEGFPDTKQYNLKLYSVSRSGTKSAPVSVKINPLSRFKLCCIGGDIWRCKSEI